MGTSTLRPAPPWRPGQSGNPRGRPKAGAAMVEWRNQMATWARPRLERVIADPKAAPPKKAAAAEWLTAMDYGRVDAHGRLDPEPGKARQRIEDRDMGKPMQSLDMLHQHVAAPRPLAEIVPALVAALSSPAIRAALAAHGLVVAALPDRATFDRPSADGSPLQPVDGTAVVVEPAPGPAPPQAGPSAAACAAFTSGPRAEGPAP